MVLIYVMGEAVFTVFMTRKVVISRIGVAPCLTSKCNIQCAQLSQFYAYSAFKHHLASDNTLQLLQHTTNYVSDRRLVEIQISDHYI